MTSCYDEVRAQWEFADDAVVFHLRDSSNCMSWAVGTHRILTSEKGVPTSKKDAEGKPRLPEALLVRKTTFSMSQDSARCAQELRIFADGRANLVSDGHRSGAPCFGGGRGAGLPVRHRPRVPEHDRSPPPRLMVPSMRWRHVSYVHGADYSNRNNSIQNHLSRETPASCSAARLSGCTLERDLVCPPEEGHEPVVERVGCWRSGSGEIDVAGLSEGKERAVWGETPAGPCRVGVASPPGGREGGRPRALQRKWLHGRAAGDRRSVRRRAAGGRLGLGRWASRTPAWVSGFLR